MLEQDIDIEIGRRLRILRMGLGISQQQLGQSLAVTFQQVQKYESGNNRISAANLYRAAHALDLPVVEFYAGLPPTTTNAAPVSECPTQITRREYRLLHAFRKLPGEATQIKIVAMLEAFVATHK